MRPTAEKRHNDYKKAIRKFRIDRETMPTGWNQYMYDNLHQYSKNKIHCSCLFCRAKTAKRKCPWSGGKNWSIADQRELDKMNYQEEEITYDLEKD